MNAKIAIIGGGSAYMASIFWGIIKAADIFSDSEIVLMDIDEEHLRLMYNLGLSMFNIAGCRVRLKMTTNRIDAIADANFVLTTFRPGGFIARHLDESIPLQYGVIGNETIGPGGLFMACRSIPIMLDIAHDVEMFSPNAFILNYTNPTNIVTGAVSRYANVKIIGLCDQHVGERYALAKLMNVNPENLWSTNVGFNHSTWMTGLFLNGQNILPKLHEFADNLSPETENNLRKSLELFSLYDAFPTYYLRYYYYSDEMLELQKKQGITRAQEIINSLPNIWASYQDAIDQRLPKPVLQRGGGDHGEFALDIIASLWNEQPKIRIINSINGNALPDFPQNSIVECPAILSKQGVQLLSQERLPLSLVGLLHSINCYEELAIEAAVQGNRNLLFKALIAHPLVQTINKAGILFEKMLNAHFSNLPQFNK